jgi:spore maturation protein CgeB
MKILFIAEAVPGSRSLQRLQALRDLGHEVVFVPTTPEGHSCEQAPSLAYRISYRLRLPFDLAGINAALCTLDAREFDVALFDNAKTVRKATLHALKRANPRLALVWFSEDDIFNPRHRTHWLAAAIPLFDLWVTTKSHNAQPEELPRLGARRILFVDNSYDPSLHHPIDLDSEARARFGADISFVGTYEAPRGESLLALARAGLNLRVWGNGWNGMANANGRLVIESRPVYGSDYSRVLCSSKINLCFLRHFNRDRQTTRSIEIPACGAFMVHEHSAEMTALLRPETEAAYFRDDGDLLNQCRRWLADDHGRAKVAAAGRQRVRDLGLSHGEAMTRVLETATSRP